MGDRPQQGVTLIELMVTIAILAIIASIAIPAYSGYIITTKKTECLNEIATIQLAEEEHFLDNNEYFSGKRENGTNTLSGASGYYSGTYSSTDNCIYEVTAGPSSDMTTYTLKATGSNELSGEGIIKTITKQ